jgi:hypothetical protein
MVPPQLNFFTLACRDVERMAGFFRSLGWPESPASEPVHRVFQLPNGVVLALYGAEHYERELGPRAEGFRGFTLGVNVGSRDEVEAAHATLSSVEAWQSSRRSSIRSTASPVSASATRRGTSGTSSGSTAHSSTNRAT